MRRNALLLVTISLLSGFAGSAMALVVGVWMLDLTGSPSLAALAGLCVYAPTLAGPWLGAVVDLLPRRPLLVATNVVLAATLLSLFAVRSAGDAWLLYLVSFAYGISYVLLDAGESALLPSALAPDRLGAVNGWRSSAQEGMKLVAPLAGAGLYAWHGGRPVVALSALAPLIAAALYAMLRLDGAASVDHPGHGLRAGLAALRREPRPAVLLAAVSIALTGFATAPVYAVVTDDLGLPATFLGVLMSAQGAGSIAAGLAAGRLIDRYGPVTVAAAGTLLVAAGLLARCLPWWPALPAGAAIGGVGLPWTLIAAVTAIQTHTPGHLLGRVSALANTVMFGPIALANPLGSAAVTLGGRPSLVAAAASGTAAALVAARSAGTAPRTRRR
ncbi:MFS transporter [Pseudosporangium ferrugineum]|uniref:Putative MFS family arabinose efflux permease n=1 Tax=Pseudosporangium ferrugineum TaxID=439699 RepID=A0A2T0S9Q9_9ACTN|nr:MFS transporter [Pseudosporangium ferrugineum]PRY30121.1 putative MFS family arabinose efflux permease [Pseudosporangium ferrugineum]